ncbi:MAG: VCBS repeat-containing protein [Pirellulaceae bacterium]
MYGAGGSFGLPAIDDWAPGVFNVSASFAGGSMRPSDAVYSVYDGSTVLSFTSPATDGFQSADDPIVVDAGQPSLGDPIDPTFLSHETERATGDFDGDGREDVIAFNDATLAAGFGSSNGLYAVNVPAWTSQSLAKQLDVDGNGLDELVVYHGGDGEWELYSFTRQYLRLRTSGSLPAGLTWNSFQPGDYDGDGTQEFAAANPITGAIEVLSLVPDVADVWASAVGFPEFLAVDVNLDGKTDLVSPDGFGSWRVAISDGEHFDVQVWQNYFDPSLTLHSNPADFQLPLREAISALQRARDEVEFEPSAKLWNHPKQTLEGGRGNAWDQANLLRELLTESSVFIDSRIAIGRADYSGSDFSWLGVDNLQAAEHLLDAAGLNPSVSGSTISFDHATVEARLPSTTGLHWRILEAAIVNNRVRTSNAPAPPTGFDPSTVAFESIARSLEIDFSKRFTDGAVRTDTNDLGPLMAANDRYGIRAGRFVVVEESAGHPVATIGSSATDLGTIELNVSLPLVGDSATAYAHDGSVRAIIERTQTDRARLTLQYFNESPPLWNTSIQESFYFFQRSRLSCATGYRRGGTADFRQCGKWTNFIALCQCQASFRPSFSRSTA